MDARNEPEQPDQSENRLEPVLKLWRQLIAHDGVQPAGLGARDVLRIEMGYSLYGHELGEDISPLESGLSRFVSLEKDFIGKNALLEQKDSFYHSCGN